MDRQRIDRSAGPATLLWRWLYALTRGPGSRRQRRWKLLTESFTRNRH